MNARDGEWTTGGTPTPGKVLTERALRAMFDLIWVQSSEPALTHQQQRAIVERRIDNRNDVGGNYP